MSVTLSYTSTNIQLGYSARLTVKVVPTDAGPVTWTSSDESVVSVSGSGTRCSLYAKGIGTAVITAAVEGFEATCTVNVYDPQSVLVTGISLSHETLALEVGQKSGVIATVTPSNAAVKTLKWTSSNTAVATVSGDGSNGGMVTAQSIGTAVITCAATDGSGVTATCKVTVNPVFVEAITLSQTELTLHEDDTEKLTATVTPSDATTKAVTWTSSNPTVVTVSSSGVLRAKNIGTATITCTALDGSGVSATCHVTVTNKTTYTVNGVSFKMVSVTGGTFKMGAQKTSSSSANYDADANDNEAPVHNVTLSNYSIGETEVTQALWVAVMGSNPSYFEGDNLPVEYVSWNDCQEFITKLNQLTGQTFRLPTEAEWEYAARGGNKGQGYKYSGSNTIGDVAWYMANSRSKTHEVGTKQPNELGLYDMSGNVDEWCQDRYLEYSSSDQFNPTVPTSSGDYDSFLVSRGGYWSFPAGVCRVSYRSYGTPTSAGYSLGLRLAQ